VLDLLCVGSALYMTWSGSALCWTCAMLDLLWIYSGSALCCICSVLELLSGAALDLLSVLDLLCVGSALC
jgi:hypothetical protein